jgi:hypothetical protein
MQAGLHDFDERAVAQQHAALRLVDRVPRAENNQREQNGNAADNDAPSHRRPPFIFAQIDQTPKASAGLFRTVVRHGEVSPIWSSPVLSCTHGGRRAAPSLISMTISGCRQQAPEYPIRPSPA